MVLIIRLIFFFHFSGYYEIYNNIQTLLNTFRSTDIESDENFCQPGCIPNVKDCPEGEECELASSKDSTIHG